MILGVHILLLGSHGDPKGQGLGVLLDISRDGSGLLSELGKEGRHLQCLILSYEERRRGCWGFGVLEGLPPGLI